MEENYIPTVEQIKQFGKINMAQLGLDDEYLKYILNVREKVVEAGCPYQDASINTFTYGLIVGMNINK